MLKSDPTTEENTPILEDYYLNPQKYQKFSGISTWRNNLNFDTYVEAPMHLLFLGIAKTLYTDVNNWLTAQNKYTAFHSKITNGILEPLEQLKLPWIKIIGYPKGKFGGWVAENFLGFTRIQLWFFTALDSLPTRIDCDFPPTDQKYWLKRHNAEWLKQRGYSSEGSAAELREQVNQLMNQDGGSPPIVTQQITQTEDIQKLLNLFHLLITTIMVQPLLGKHILQAEVIARVFLNDYSSFVDLLYKDNKNSTHKWISKYNFMSLLARLLEKYGKGDTPVKDI